MRLMLSWLAKQWATLDQAHKDTWSPAAAAAATAPFNEYCRVNMRRWRSHRAPSKQFPATEDGAIGLTMAPTVTHGPDWVKIVHNIFLPWDNWIMAFRRSLTPGWTKSPADFVAITLCDTAGLHEWIDRRLSPGTYYYQYIRMTVFGFMETTMTEKEVTVP